MAMIPSKIRNRKKSSLSQEDKKMIRKQKQLANKRAKIAKRQKQTQRARGTRS